MKRNKVPTIPFRRKRDKLTNYRKRLSLLKSRTPRLVVRSSIQNMLMQIVEYHPQGDKILVEAHSSELKKYGMDVVNGNIPCAYLTGLVLAKKAKAAGITTAIVDFGLQTVTAGSKLFAAVKGAVDGGLDVPLGEQSVPSQDRLIGKHIATNKATKFTRVKNVEKYPDLVQSVKNTILKS